MNQDCKNDINSELKDYTQPSIPYIEIQLGTFDWLFGQVVKKKTIRLVIPKNDAKLLSYINQLLHNWDSELASQGKQCIHVQITTEQLEKILENSEQLYEFGRFQEIKIRNRKTFDTIFTFLD